MGLVLCATNAIRSTVATAVAGTRTRRTIAIDPVGSKTMATTKSTQPQPTHGAIRDLVDSNPIPARH